MPDEGHAAAVPDVGWGTVAVVVEAVGAQPASAAPSCEECRAGRRVQRQAARSAAPSCGPPNCEDVVVGALVLVVEVDAEVVVDAVDVVIVVLV